jgi:hypothetical protein
MENNFLVKVSTYATYAGVSTMAIYKQIERGAIKSEKVDDVTFVVIDKITYDAIMESKKR